MSRTVFACMLAAALTHEPVAALEHQHDARPQAAGPALAVGAALDAGGRLWLASVENQRLWISRSDDGGRRLGSYWLDAANTGKYGGHTLVNLRANYPFGKGMEVYGSVSNLFDKRDAETADGTGTAPTSTAGLPRSVVVGLQA